MFKKWCSCKNISKSGTLVKMIDFDKSKWLLDLSDFEKDKKKEDFITGFGMTQFCTQKSTNRKCVVFKADMSLNEEISQKSFERSISILAMNEHPAIIPFIGFFEIKKFGYIVEEKEKSLYNLLIDAQKRSIFDPLFDSTHKLIIMYGISCAMEFLHKKLIIHRDLKPSNIFLDSELHPFLSGFECAKKIDTSINVNHMFRQITTIIMAPELLDDLENFSNSLPIDVYAYGITIYHLITQIEPYHNTKQYFRIMKAVFEGKRPEIPSNVPNNYVHLISRCWSQEPEKRPNFTEICDLLESEEFLNDPEIDRERFEDYKKLVYPFRAQKS